MGANGASGWGNITFTGTGGTLQYAGITQDVSASITGSTVRFPSTPGPATLLYRCVGWEQRWLSKVGTGTLT